MPLPLFTFGRLARPAIIPVLPLLVTATAVVSAQEYRYVETLGIHDAGHVSPRGQMYSFLHDANDAGVTLGRSSQYSSETRVGATSWWADPHGRVHRFDDPAPDTPSGFSPYMLTGSGFMAGPSTEGAWLRTLDGNWVAIGLRDAAHGASNPHDLNEYGVVVGTAELAGGYWRTDSEGYTDWVNPYGYASWMSLSTGQTFRLGVFDAEHQAPSDHPNAPFLQGYQNHEVGQNLTNSGYVTGSSYRFVGDESRWHSFNLGRTAWVAGTRGTFARLGFTDALHTAPDGYRFSFAEFIAESGVIAGYSLRFPGSQDWPDDGEPPQTAWRAHVDAPAPVAIGHYDVAHTRADGYVRSEVRAVSKAGRIGGVSRRFSGMEEVGRTAWVVEPNGVMRDVGLNDALHRGPNGEYDHGVTVLSDLGYVVGRSVQFGAGISSPGSSAWVMGPSGTTVRIGFYGPEHTRDDGYQSSSAYQIWHDRWVIGSSERFDENGPKGQTGWIHDLQTGVTHSLEFSEVPAGAWGYSAIRDMLPDGTGVGVATYYPPNAAPEGRAIIWTPGEGVRVLQDLLESQLPSSQIKALTDAYHISPTGHIVGLATPTRTYAEPNSAIFLIRRIGSEPEPPPPGPSPATPLDYVGRLGFVGARHTGPDGRQDSEIWATSRSLFSAGVSTSYVPGGRLGWDGLTAWVGNALAASQRVGYYDALHTAASGRQESGPFAVNSQGVTIGYSVRYDGDMPNGQSAWVADRWGTTIKVGFYDADHKAAETGYTFSMPVDLNERNQLVGYSAAGPDAMGTAWRADSVGRIARIGPAAPVEPTGEAFASRPYALNDDGLVVGAAEYTSANRLFTFRDLEAWFHMPWGSVRRIGFFSGVHAGGQRRFSEPQFLTESGYAAGYSRRYQGDVHVGQTAWVTHRDGPNRPVGFYSGIHLAGNGAAYSAIRAINERGNSIGISAQYDQSDPLRPRRAGSSAWIARPDASLVRVGLYDVEHTSGGFQVNTTVAMNGADALVGQARRFAADGSDLGTDAWVANLAGYTTRLGLTDAAHTARGGLRTSRAEHITTTSNLVAGYSVRYHGGAVHRGQTAWIYHRTTRTYQPLVISTHPTTGYAFARITSLREDGTAFGVYRLFGADGTDHGRRAFIHRPGEGTFDLGDALDIDTTAAGWTKVHDPVLTTPGGAILGHGMRVNQGSTLPRSHGAFLAR